MDVLLVGNDGYFNKETILEAFPGDTVVVCGSSHENERDGSIRWVNQPIMSEEFRMLFATYGFERVVFMSHFITKDSKGLGEIENLRTVFSMTQKSQIRQFIYVTSDEALLDATNSASIIFDSAENLCNYYSSSYNIDVRVIYTPHLINATYKDDYFSKIFARLDRSERVEVKALEGEIASFLSVPDLALFLKRLCENWELDEKNSLGYGVTKIYLRSGARTTYGEIHKEILRYYPGAKISFIKSGIKGRMIYGEDKARNEYGWFAKVDACQHFGEYIEEYRQSFCEKPTLRERIRQKLRLNSRFMMVLELVLGTLLVEIYNRYSGGSVQFRMIDVRLLFVVLMSSIYGTSVGVITAFIEIASLNYAYFRQGTNAQLLFYDPGNWIPFILLMVAAAVCGYAKQKTVEDIGFVREENKVIKSQNVFISELYKEAMEYKNQYKQDLIGSRDGFGRIFDVVKKLSTTVPEEIFAESIPVMEDVLDNNSIAIYTINDKNARCARLSVSSGQISKSINKSLSLDDYREVLEIVKEKDIWFNSDIKEGHPTYVSGIRSEGELLVLILIYRVNYHQMGTYYMNLIRILTGLMENFLLKAWDYQKAVAEETYVEGTAITRWDHFKQQLEIQKEMAANKLTSYRLFRIMREDRSLSELDEMFQSKIRNNDILGLGDDGNIYLLASQVDESSQDIVLRRFRNMGLICDIVENVA